MFPTTFIDRLTLKSKLLYSGLFVLSSFLVLTTSLFTLVRYSKLQPQVLGASTENTDTPSGVRLYASLPEELPSISAQVVESDARYEIIKNYLSYYNSPLEKNYKTIVDTADKYKVDFRLITAIAQQESNLCKRIPAETYNCWGWGIHSRGTLGFTSFDEGIEAVTKGLREEYINKGYNTVDKIMSKYTPSSNGSWAFGVETFINDMR